MREVEDNPVKCLWQIPQVLPLAGSLYVYQLSLASLVTLVLQAL